MSEPSPAEGSPVAGGPAPEGSPAPERPERRPAHVDLFRAALVGTLAWALALLVLLVVAGRLSATGRGWWLQTAAAGVLLGLLGMAHTRRRR